MDALRTLKTEPPVSAVDAIEHLMPAPGIRIPPRPRPAAPTGSLGHARYVALADWQVDDALPARPKRSSNLPIAGPRASAPNKKKVRLKFSYQTIINRAVRCPDPFVQLRGRWIVRRLGPHPSCIELASLRGPDTELRLLHAMGFETAISTSALLPRLQNNPGAISTIEIEMAAPYAVGAMLETVRGDREFGRRRDTTESILVGFTLPHRPQAYKLKR